MTPHRPYVILTVVIAAAGAAYLYNRAEPQQAATAPSPGSAAAAPEGMRVSDTAPQLTIGNKHYVFDISGHSPEEIEELLKRAQAMFEEARKNEDELDIAMVLHGPDIEVFARQNYQSFKDIVDLASRLDEERIIDFKACEVAATNRGFSRADIPEFIEMVPYAPDEIKRLSAEGYVVF